MKMMLYRLIKRLNTALWFEDNGKGESEELIQYTCPKYICGCAQRCTHEERGKSKKQNELGNLFTFDFRGKTKIYCISNRFNVLTIHQHIWTHNIQADTNTSI